MESKVNEAELRAISEEILAEIKNSGPVNAVNIWFYLEGTDTTGSYSAGMVEWAPNGDWGDANTVRSGDYSLHRFTINAGSPFGDYKGPVATGIDEGKRKEIYSAIVKAERRATSEAERMHPIPDPSKPGYSQDKAGEQIKKQWESEGTLMTEYQAEVAERYDITEEQILEISVEGVMNHWPTP